jgi:Trypsin-like peptidase domain
MRRVRYAVLALLALATLGPTLLVAAQEERRPASEIIPSSVMVLGGMVCETEPAPDGDPMGIPIADTCEASIPASGTIVTPEKLILTAATAALDPARENPVWTVVFLTVDERNPPVAAFFARPVIYDERIDLALLQPKWTLSGEPVSEQDLAALTPLEMSGEEAAVEVEETVRLIGYPYQMVTNKETISVVPAQVAGFLPDEENPELGGGAFFKADASVGPGLDGGTVVNEAGVLVGVPRSSRGGPVQCADVDGDGEIDQARECFVRGGEITDVRPIPEGLNLLYERAEEAGQLGGEEPTPAPQETPGPGPDDPDPAATPTADDPRSIPFPRRGGRPTEAPTETALVAGTIVSADTGDPIEGAYFIVLEPGTTVQDFVDAEGDPALVFGLGVSNGRGRFQVDQPVQRDEEYSIVAFADGYGAIGGDGIVLARADDPDTVDLGEIELPADE